MDPPPGLCQPGPGDPQKRDKYPSCSSCLQEAGPGCGWCSELNTQGTEAERKLGRQSVELSHFFNSLKPCIVLQPRAVFRRASVSPPVSSISAPRRPPPVTRVSRGLTLSTSSPRAPPSNSDPASSTTSGSEVKERDSAY